MYNKKTPAYRLSSSYDDQSYWCWGQSTPLDAEVRRQLSYAIKYQLKTPKAPYYFNTLNLSSALHFPDCMYAVYLGQQIGVTVQRVIYTKLLPDQSLI